MRKYASSVQSLWDNPAQPTKTLADEDTRFNGSTEERYAWMRDKQATRRLKQRQEQAAHARTFINRGYN